MSPVPKDEPRAWPEFVAAAGVFALYLLTVPRDLAGMGVDSAKFAFLPRILGVPHPPGYPLYMLIGWAFSHVPIGSLAFRMNLLSAVFGAGTVLLTTLIARELRCSPIVAIAAGFLAGTGPLFWSQALIAEVYTLHTFLVGGMFLGLLRWSRTRTPAGLYVAACSFGFGLAHHTDIAVFVPAILLFLAVTDWRVLVNIRVVATACAIVVLCLGLYAYVIVRTRQGAAYVEVPVTDLRGLLALVRGDRFDYLLFRQPFAQSLHERTPVFLHFATTELGVPSLVLAAIGVWAVWRRQRAAALFLVAGIAGVMAFAFSYYAVDIEVFLLPAFVLLWVLAASAVAAAPWTGRWPRWLGAATIAVWAALHVTESYATVSRQSTGFDARFARAFFQRLPEHAAIVDNTIDVATVMLYKILGEHAAAGKDLRLVAPAIPPGHTGVLPFVRSDGDVPVARADLVDLERLVQERSAVFVFGTAATRLRAEGFRLSPVQLADRRLADFLASLPRGQIVVAAVPRMLTGSALVAKEPMFGAVGAHMRAASPSACYMAAGVVGDATGAIESVRGDRLDAARGQRIGSGSAVLPVDVTTRCGETAASITVNGRDVARTEAAIAIAVLGPSGEIVTVTTAPAASGLTVPFHWMPMGLHRIDAPRSCVPIGSTWSDVAAVAAEAGVSMHVPSGSAVRMYMWSDGPLRVRGAQVNEGDVSMDVDEVSSSEASEPLPHGVRGVTPFMRITRVLVRPRADDRISIALALGGRPAAAIARVEGSAPTSVCALTLGNYPILSGSFDGFERMLMDDARADLFGPGWRDFEDDGAGGVRRIHADRAHVFVPLSRAVEIRVSIDAIVPGREGTRGKLSLAVNGHSQGAVDAGDGWTRFEWTVPAEQWRAGVNDLELGGAGIRVREIDFRQSNGGGGF